MTHVAAVRALASACVRRPLARFCARGGALKKRSLRCGQITSCTYSHSRVRVACGELNKSAMRRAVGGGADGGATAAELGAGNGCMPGSRARRCFVVGGLPRVTGRIGPSRVAPSPQGNPTTNQSETSLVSDAPWTKEAEEGLKSSSLRAIRVTKRGGHTHA